MDISNWIFGGLAGGMLYWYVRPTLAVRQIAAPQLERWLASADPPQVIDVRTMDEFGHGHIGGSLAVPLSQLRARVGEIRRDGAVVLVCRSGYRAMQAYQILRRRRYRNLYVLRGGMLAWLAHRRAAAPAGEEWADPVVTE